MALAAPPGTGAPPSPGYYDFSLSTRTFDSPLFTSTTSGMLRFYSRQTLPGSGEVGAWFQGGLPDRPTWFGVAGWGLPLGTWSLDANGGDFALYGAQPPELNLPLTDAYPLRGVGLAFSRGPVSWGLFGGRARYTLDVAGLPPSQTALYGGEVHTRWNGNIAGGRLTVVDDAVYIDPARNGETALVATGNLVHRTNRRFMVFADLSATGDADLGFRAGAGWLFRLGEVTAAAYRYDDGFPVVYPLYRPGESGLELRGGYRPTGLTRLYGNVRFVAEDALRDRRDLRGTVGLDVQGRGRRPSLSFAYSRDDLVERTLLSEDIASIADRLAVSVGRYSSQGHVSGTLEHMRITGDAGFDRSQALLTFRRVVGARTTVDGLAVVQRDEWANMGMTAESAIERPLAARYYWLAGLGAAVVNRQGNHGEGVLRLGASRRIGRNGWFARVELRLPFDIGLERSYLNRQIAAVDLGNRFSWSDLRDLRAALPGAGPSSGVIEGSVSYDGEGIAGLAMLVDGTPRGVTGPDGRFRLTGVPVGERRLAIDTRTLEPGYEIEGDPQQVVEVRRGSPAPYHFEVARYATLQGAVVACEGDRRVGVRSASLTLSGPGFERTARTDTLGGFHFTRLPRGLYELALDHDPGQPGGPPPMRVELGRDIFGLVLEIGCPAETGPPGPTGER